jgi:hypothetical protein
MASSASRHRLVARAGPHGSVLIPILLGNGIRLFEDLDPEGIGLRRTSTIDTPGATRLRSEAVKA